ncbi:cupin domain-containing protein [Anaeromyxobacter sp. SG64]|uniref:cupin domain-containing protein n=1 Tax=Anaeromyxobacter sp. SG64 TaxID=2925409 RepID=UPI001F56D501|nr:cupin domain-containing protein [Anaeromyxobacter sp. SG64]
MAGQDVFDLARHVAASAATARLPRAGGKRFETVFRHGSLQVEIFAPRGRDTQRPHDRDEVYVVLRGAGAFVNGTQRFAFRAGDVLFAAAGEVHWFEDFSEDFFTWVLFYGPEGGEKAATAPPPAGGAAK